jgi:ketosteroid isomerase-like protein
MVSFTDPIKQEIWATVRSMNDAWTKGNPDDLFNFFHQDMVAITPTDRNRRDGGVACVAGWKGFCNAVRIHRWEEIDPVIHVYGNSAVVAYYFDMSFDMGGNTINMGGRDMFFFVIEGGKWWAVANQFSPYPA